jgi:hypothetical protein
MPAEAVKAIASLKSSIRDLDDFNDIVVLPALQAILAAKSALAHHGTGTNIAALTQGQRKLVDLTLLKLKGLVMEIFRGNHDDKIHQSFLLTRPVVNNQGYATDIEWKKYVDTLKIIRHVFLMGFEAAEMLHRNQHIVIDTTLDATHCAGLTGKTMIRFTPGFFDDTENKRVSSLCHESTHAITSAKYSNIQDAGGYPNSVTFRDCNLSERLENASHYHYVINLINNDDVTLYAGNDPTGTVREAHDIMRHAWIQAIDWYGHLMKYCQGVRVLLHQPNDSLETQTYVWFITRVLGLASSTQSLPKSTDPSINITGADLAFAENRVGKLGTMMNMAEKAYKSLSFLKGSVDDILEKVVEMEGPLRKGTNNQKTVDMIKAMGEAHKKNNTPLNTFINNKYKISWSFWASGSK